MLETALLLFIALLIVMPVVAIVLMGLQRLGNLTWKPVYLSVATVIISATLVLGYAWLG